MARQRKTLAALACFATTALVLAACSSATTSSTPPGSTAAGTGGAGAVSTGAKPGPPNSEAMLRDHKAILPDGRMVTPAGTSYDVGTFPTGLVVSPDGAIAVTVNTGRGTGDKVSPASMCNDFGKEDRCDYLPADAPTDATLHEDDESLSVIDLSTGAVTSVVAVPTDPDKKVYNYFALGLAFSPDGKHLYASGGGNDSVYDFAVEGKNVTSPPRTTKLPSVVSGRGKLPVLGDVKGYTKGLAISPDQQTLLVVKEYDSDVSVVDAATFEVRQQLSLDTPSATFGSYLYGVAFAPAGDTAYVTAQGTGNLISIGRGADGQWAKKGEVRVGDHPTGLAVAGDATVLVANANDDTVAVVDANTMTVKQTIKVHAIDGASWGAVPNAIAFRKDGSRAYVALAGDDATGVLDRDASGTWKVAGYVPAAWYPTGVAVLPGGDVLTASAKGLGIRFVPGINDANAPKDAGPQATESGVSNAKKAMPGIVNRVPDPSAAELDGFSKTVRENIGFVTKDLARSAHNPIPAKVGDPSPIKHVIYVVRENRTFDQIFGDLGATRSDVDADPRFEILATATPNAHALLGWGATGDRFFSNGEESIEGHWWTAASNVSDYTEKGWIQESERGRPYDFVVPTAQTKGCTVFGAAQKKKDATNGAFTYKNYGEPLAYLMLDSGTGKEVDPCPKVPDASNFKPLMDKLTDLGVDDRTRVPKFLADIGIDENGKDVGDPATNVLPNFSYLTLPEDHTTGLRETYTPRAEIAQNDQALGMLVQAVSHSKYWKDTAILVVEDDSQDGPDHVDGHRNVLLSISPYAKKTGGGGAVGYVSHQHLDQSSVVRTIGLIFGWEPLAAYDQLALPLYDLFQDVDDPAKLTPADLKPYDKVDAPPFVEETSASQTSAKAQNLKARSAKLDLDGWDKAGPDLEAILWESVRDDPIPAELQHKLEQPAPPAAGDDDDEGR